MCEFAEQFSTLATSMLPQPPGAADAVGFGSLRDDSVQGRRTTSLDKVDCNYSSAGLGSANAASLMVMYAFSFSSCPIGSRYLRILGASDLMDVTR